ncbi:MAG: TonB-dependent receptor [Opitutaceae bacterium]|nr:TonB-dependent receptor [Opitutaceae bacterium]
MTPPRRLHLIAFFTLGGLAAVLASAQPAATGAISGRVFHAATGAYVRNAEVRVEGTNLAAYTEDAGFFRLSGVPAGTLTLTVSYTGAPSTTATLTLGAGQTVTRDFELAGAGKDSVVQLGAFVVASEREGNAKAIMDQRAALNAKSVVATDNYGDLTMGDVGEFMKYLPGVALDYLEVDTNAVRIGGLDPKYATFTQDGNRMAAGNPSFGDASRANTFEQMSITGIESVEVNNTLTAAMDADSAAGNVNLRSKNAFERKGRQIVYQAYAMGTSDAITLARSYLPDDRKHPKVFPAGQLGYADVFLGGTLGIEANASYNKSYIFQDRHQLEYNYTNPDRPVITGLMWRPGPKVATRIAGNFSLDYKVSPEIVFSLRSSYSHYDVEFFNQYTWLRANVAQITPDSTLTKVTALATTNANTRLGTEYSHRHNYQDTYTVGPKLEFKRDSLTLTLGGSYSRSLTSNKDRDDGFFRNTNNRVTRMSWTAERSGTDQTAWNVRQLSGRDWSLPESWGRDDAFANNILSNANRGKAQNFSGYLKAIQNLRVLELPVELKAGLTTRLSTHALTQGDQQWTYVGPTGVAAGQLSSPVLATQRYRFDPHMGGNIINLGWRADDTYGMYRLFQAHPEYFLPNTVTNFTNTLIGARAVKEQVDAAYVEGNTRWGGLRLNGGLRYERTRTVGRIWDPRPDAVVRAAGYTAGTIPFVLYKYRNGERSSRYGDYDNLFLSGGAKYSFTRNLVGQLSSSESILRPNYDNLAGITSIDDTNQIVTVPNPGLKPELSRKTFASLQYYFEPAGMIGISAYRLDVKNQLSARSRVSAEQAGFANEPEYASYSFLSYVNGSGSQHTNGVSAEYNQQMTFLPGALKGLSVFGSVTRTIADRQQLRLAPKSANGGVRYRYGPLNLQVRSTWQSARLISISSNAVNGLVWAKERTLVDLSGGYKLTKRLELMLSVRNIFNAPAEQYSNVPGRLQLFDVYGSLWNFGVKGTF